jgi:membrane associated rhomboid family serine protease
MYYFYWLPIGTDAKVRGIPWASAFLLVAMVVSYAALQVIPSGETLAYRLAFKAGHPTPLTAVASLFLHADPFHLLGNLIFLGVFGPPLESRLGPARFLVAAIGCGWLASLVQAAWILHATPELASIPIIGASGAISGLMGIFLVRLYFARLRFASVTMLFFQGMVRPARFTLPAVIGIGLWFALQFAYQISGAAPQTATLCHLGGFVFGGIFAWSMGLMGEGHLESHLARGARYASRGEWFASLGEYESYLARRPDDAEVVAQVARLSRVTHQEDHAVERFREAIHLWLRQGEIRSACDAYEEMKRLLGAVTLPPADLLRVARGCEELGRPGDASRAYEAYGRNYPDRGGAALALMKSAEIEHRALNNPGRARYLYDELLRRPLKPDLEKLVHERVQRADAALERQGSPAGAASGR